jgi:KUP system potassium uptake protein
MAIVHTSHHQAGQIYIPQVNQLLAIGTLLLVFTFQNADRLASAYGIAVTGTMGITSILFHVVATREWHWPRLPATLLTLAFLTVDLAFFLSNISKFMDGGWVPIAIAVSIYTMMSTWKRGREMLTRILTAGSLEMDLFLQDVAKRKPVRVSGTAVFMTSTDQGVPVVLLHHLKHNKVLHEQVILMSIRTFEVPELEEPERIQVQKLEHGFWRIIASYGFMETPNVPELLHYAKPFGLRAKQMDTTFYLGRERLIIARSGTERPGARRAPPEANVPRMARWRKKIFMIMSRNARSATEFFGIPPNRVVELGAQVEF